MLRNLLPQFSEFKRLPTLKMEAAGPSKTWALTYQLHAVTSQKTLIVIHTTTRIWEFVSVVVAGTLLFTGKINSQNISSEFDYLFGF